MPELTERTIGCPYCGEAISILVDESLPEQQYTEDCQVATDVTAETSHIEDGPHVYPKGTWTAETSRRIACDCSVVGIKEDKNGEPLSIGRRSRSIPPPIRRALGIRDGGCRFPGCTNNRIEQWMDREFFEATADREGCAAKWYAGEQMDWNMAVSALFPYQA